MRLNVSEKLSISLLVVLLSFILPWQFNLLLFVVLHGTRALAPFRPTNRQHARRFWKLQRYFLILVLIMTAINGMLVREGQVFLTVGTVSLSVSGILLGLHTGIRLLVIGTILLMVFGSTPMPAVASFFHHLGLPAQLVMAFLLTLNFLDHLPTRIEQVFTAQEARGAPVRANLIKRALSFLSILTPLVLSSLVESIDRGLALELRGFHGGTKLFADTQDSNKLSILTVVTLILSFLCVLILICLWLFPSLFTN